MRTPKRRKTDTGVTVGGWVYDDEEQMRFAVSCSTMVGIPSLDNYIDALPSSKAKTELLHLRQGAFDAWKEGNQRLLKSRLETLWAIWTAHTQMDAARPVLETGVAFTGAGRGQSQRYSAAEEIMRRHSQWGNKQVLDALVEQRVVDSYNESEINWSDTDEPTTRKAFNNRLAEIRTRLGLSSPSSSRSRS